MHFLLHVIERAVIYDIVFRLMHHLTLPEALALGGGMTVVLLFGARLSGFGRVVRRYR
ncbi:hypothetical protein [Acidiphilium sp.]|uniref:hypothetical protein n=1 Tax=Acidiphilium sp. TaxID=527 RepID=UPI003CFC577A